MSPQKALESVGNKLQEQYEWWQPRVRFLMGGMIFEVVIKFKVDVCVNSVML